MRGNSSQTDVNKSSVAFSRNMTDSFFGFDTSLPAFEDTELETNLVKEEDVDEKNEETFGDPVPVTSPPRIQDEEEGNKPRIGGKSIKEILTQEYKKSKEIVSLEEELEEEEIIENSISQLGLDDEVDEKESHTATQLDNDVANWVVPPQGTPERASLESSSFIQDILSPDKRGIWTSPGHGEDNSFSPARDSKQPDLLKQLFSTNNRKDSIESQLESRANQSIDVIKAEDLERGLTADKDKVLQDSSTPVIIERRMPRTPAPPPGFPFPIGTPPSGIPWMTPPGMMPISPMMLAGHMQQMLAASPHLAMLRGMPPPLGLPRGRLFDPRFGMPGDSMQRGRYNRGGKQRRWDQGGNLHYQKTRWNKGGSYDMQDDVLKLPPSNLMTSREKEWLVKIQLMALISDDMENKDYYYVNYMNKIATKIESERSEEEKSKKDTEKDSFNKLLDIVEQKKEERKYRPAVFEGSLGKPSVATVHHPRQVVDVSSKENDEEEMQAKMKTPEGMKKRFNIYGSIEKAYDIILAIEDIERRLLDVPDLERSELVPEKALKIDALFNTMKLSTKNWQKGSVNDLFLQLMCIPKGKRLFFRALKYFKKEQRDCACLSVVSNLQILAKKDSHDKILLPLMQEINSRLTNVSDEIFQNTLNAILANNFSQLFLYSFGLNFVSNLLEKIQDLFRTREAILREELKTVCENLKSQVTVALDQMSLKNRERHSLEIDRLSSSLKVTSSLSPPRGVEE